MINVEIPIDSNMMVFTGNNSEFLDIFDVYRPFPTAEIRYYLRSDNVMSVCIPLIEHPNGVSGAPTRDLTFYQ